MGGGRFSVDPTGGGRKSSSNFPRLEPLELLGRGPSQAQACRAEPGLACGPGWARGSRTGTGRGGWAGPGQAGAGPGRARPVQAGKGRARVPNFFSPVPNFFSPVPTLFGPIPLRKSTHFGVFPGRGPGRAGGAWPSRARLGRARSGQAGPGRAGPGWAAPGSWAGLGLGFADRDRPGEPGRAGPGRAGPGRGRPGRAGPGWDHKPIFFSTVPATNFHLNNV